MDLEDIKKQIRKMLAQDENNKNLNIADEDLLTYYYYLQNNKKDNEYGYRQELKTTPFTRVVWVPTEKSKKIQFQEYWQSQNALFEGECNLDQYSFNKLIVDNENKKKVSQAMQKIIKNFATAEKGFYLYGSFKIGKTFFLKVLAHELLKKEIPVMFLFMPNLTRKFKSFFHNNSLETRFQQLKKIDCLILDDLGVENMNPWFRDEILLPLLHYRSENKLPIFISSNYNFLQLEKHLSNNITDNNYIKIAKIITQINELTRFYDFSQKETS
ncbi:ATP-binding protein ['Fragaria x ananassa' phyllody phytoplasma]|uniref:ATP-binding protein n=1 Tax='Fragaria x ananassa' phyllody phytoplasma TaxID=2358428 RepID=A0ABS5K2P2_9MOLU|nr:ATP-binding protein ['Fragaria x ananassa' phyllody phytoplasma]MBS2126139.1 ATP-binding protein ['Fragaria x ananassa' phyllody phytoplasma]